jgi:hypothetical protein
MRALSRSAAAIFVTLLIGCASDTPDGSSSPPTAPKLSSVDKMDGSLHVTWTNNDTCDAVEGESKAMMASGAVHHAYSVAFTVPGDVDNKHDTTATDDMTYTYRLRCKKGSLYSSYSNEISANPKK